MPDPSRTASSTPSSINGWIELAQLYAAPQHVGFRVRYRTGAIERFWPYRTGAMQDLGYGLPRTPLLLLQ